MIRTKVDWYFEGLTFCRRSQLSRCSKITCCRRRPSSGEKGRRWLQPARGGGNPFRASRAIPGTNHPRRGLRPRHPSLTKGNFCRRLFLNEAKQCLLPSFPLVMAHFISFVSHRSSPCRSRRRHENGHLVAQTRPPFKGEL